MFHFLKTFFVKEEPVIEPEVLSMRQRAELFISDAKSLFTNASDSLTQGIELHTRVRDNKIQEIADLTNVVDSITKSIDEATRFKSNIENLFK